MRKIAILICIASIFALGAGFQDIGNRIKERGKCRQIRRANCEVRILFMNPEDAELFARDLKDFIGE